MPAGVHVFEGHDEIGLSARCGGKPAGSVADESVFDKIDWWAVVRRE